jgi:hypothetical protein
VADSPLKEFGRRKPVLEAEPSPPTKRSRHVALLLMGTVAVGGGAYALMPAENCAPTPPGMAAAPGQACQPRSSSWGGGHGGYYGGSSVRTSLFGGDAATTSPGGSTSEGGHVSRGGFGAMASAFSAHFSVGS